MVTWRRIYGKRTIRVTREGNLMSPLQGLLLYALYHSQNSTYHDPCYTNYGALARTRNSSWVNRNLFICLFK